MADPGTATFIRHEVEGLLADDDRGLAAAVAPLTCDHALRRRIATHNRTTGTQHDWPHVVAPTPRSNAPWTPGLTPLGTGVRGLASGQIRLQVDHLPGDRAPKPLWLWTSRCRASADQVDSAWQAFLLYTSTKRDLLIRIAQAGLVQAKWTDAILDEVFDNLTTTRRHPGDESRNPSRIHRLLTHLLDGCGLAPRTITGYGGGVGSGSELEGVPALGWYLVSYHQGAGLGVLVGQGGGDTSIDEALISEFELRKMAVTCFSTALIDLGDGQLHQGRGPRQPPDTSKVSYLQSTARPRTPTEQDVQHDQTCDGEGGRVTARRLRR